MNKREFEILLERYQKGECTAREAAAIEKILFAGADEHVGKLSEAEQIDLETRWADANRHTGATGKRVSILRLLPYVAAAVLIGLFIFLYSYKSSWTSNETVFISDVAPGSNRATLKLADGSVINLEERVNGEVATQNGIKIVKTATGQVIYTFRDQLAAKTNSLSYNTISTPNGGEFAVELPDGSKAWLNAASSVHFPTNLGSGIARELSITGEVYFEVKKDTARPFRVKSGSQTVEVLGTHFSINSYADEPQATTSLLEGSVRITSPSLPSGIVLKPGQQAVFRQNKKLEIVPVDESVIAWKNGLIRARNADLKTVMRQLARWYDLEVVYQGQISNESINAAVPRTSRLATVLEFLSGIGVEFKIEQTETGKRIIVQGN